MAVAIASTTIGGAAPSGSPGVFSLSVARLSGEGLLVGVYYQYSFGAADAITSVVWDPAGDNQALTLLQLQQAQTANQWLAVYYLAAPTSVKTGNITVTFAGATNDFCEVMARHIAGHDTATMIRGSAKFTQQVNDANPVSDSIDSATDDLVVDFLFVRDDKSVLTEGAGQSDRANDTVGSSSFSLVSTSKAGAASVAMAWTSEDTLGPFQSSHILASIELDAGGGGGGTFQSAWASGSNIVISSGARGA